jgi:hypothetical protein
MNERIKELWQQAQKVVGYTDGGYTEIKALDQEKFAELIIKDCITIAKDWEDELENSGLLEESNAVGIVKYRIARQFGVKL